MQTIIFKGAIFHIVNTIIFSGIYFFLHESSFKNLLEREDEFSNLSKLIDCTFFAINNTSSVGLTSLIPVTIAGKIAVMTQQLLVIFANAMIVLFLFLYNKAK